MTGGVISNQRFETAVTRHVDGDGRLSRFMKRLFIADHGRRPRGPNASPTRNLTEEEGSACFDSVETPAFYFESDRLSPTLFYHFFRFQAWRSEPRAAGMCTRHTASSYFSKSMRNMLELSELETL